METKVKSKALTITAQAVVAVLAHDFELKNLKPQGKKTKENNGRTNTFQWLLYFR